MVTTRSSNNPKPTSPPQATESFKEQESQDEYSHNDGSVYEDTPEPADPASSQAPAPPMPPPVRPAAGPTPAYRAAVKAYHEEQVEWLIITRDNNRPDPYGTQSTTSGPLTWNTVADLYRQRYGGTKVITQQAVSKRYLKHRNKFLQNHPNYPKSIEYTNNIRPQKRRSESIDDGQTEPQSRKRARTDHHEEADTNPATHSISSNNDEGPHNNTIANPIGSPGINAEAASFGPSEQYDDSTLNELDFLLEDNSNLLVGAGGVDVQNNLGGDQSLLNMFENPSSLPGENWDPLLPLADENGGFNDHAVDNFQGEVFNNAPIYNGNEGGQWGTDSQFAFEPSPPYYDHNPIAEPHRDSDVDFRHVIVTVTNDEGEDLGQVYIPEHHLLYRSPWLLNQTWTLESPELNVTIKAKRLLGVERYAMCLDPKFSRSHTLTDIDINMRQCSKINWTIEEHVELYVIATQFDDEEIKDQILRKWKDMLANGGNIVISRHALNDLYIGTPPDHMGVKDRARKFWSEVVHCAGLRHHVIALGGEDLEEELYNDLLDLVDEDSGVKTPWELDNETFAERFLCSINGGSSGSDDSNVEVSIEYDTLAARLMAAQGWYNNDMIPMIARMLRDAHYGAMGLVENSP
ncbi:hypothetical protein DM02DRAFT_655911 [Periconia macrospinosa]|uniref:Uncharacterized protein n=1 Tax=Periconia macrospinosa TaxID=97972 RepID=A0A2V1DPK5_9PLEO|nr:hypothetical protein DM02DRAFT_655911 [Periconia macrospinosa]